MRRLLLTCLLAALVLPTSALAVRLSPGDGTLAVRNASGEPGQLVVSLNVHGAAIGHLNRGRLMVLPGVGPEPEVTGAERRIDRADGTTVYIGTDIRFRAVAGSFRVRIAGTGIDVNAVGQGMVRLVGFTGNSAAAGRYSLNGGPWTPLPDGGATFPIGS